jgi:hypothetical protein
MGRLNKPARGNYTYRSPGQTNARDVTPNLREDVVESQRADAERIRKGLGADAAREYNRRLQQEAGGRAILRTAGRLGHAGTALGAGYEAGRKLDEETGAGKKLVDATGLGKAAERAAKPKEKVELSEYAKQRMVEEDVDDALRKAYAAEGKKRGGKVSASSRGDGIAKRGKTRGRMI